MSEDVSKPTHSDEDKARYDREYERIFGKKPIKKSTKEPRVKTKRKQVV